MTYTNLETEAQATAERHDFDTAVLRFNRDRYSCGSLAKTRVAPWYRALYSRALAIACEKEANADPLDPMRGVEFPFAANH